MSKQKAPKFRPVANPEMNAAMVGKRTSNAAGTHQDGRMKRARTRNASLRVALRDA